MPPATPPGKRVYGIVGDGRMARHMAHYLGLSGLPVRRWSRRTSRGVAPQQALREADVVLVLISDTAIEPFLESHGELAGQRPIHFSGSLVTPRARGMHPLSSFGRQLYTLETYRSIPFVCEPEARFEEAFPELENASYTLSCELKARYHALSVLAGNFTTVLWRKLFRDFEELLELPREVALPYLEQVCQNLRRDPEGALTGPLARGDRRTVQANLEALRGDPFERVYRECVLAVAPGLLAGTGER